MSALAWVAIGVGVVWTVITIILVWTMCACASDAEDRMEEAMQDYLEEQRRKERG